MKRPKHIAQEWYVEVAAFQEWCVTGVYADCSCMLKDDEDGLINNDETLCVQVAEDLGPRRCGPSTTENPCGCCLLALARGEIDNLNRWGGIERCYCCGEHWVCEQHIRLRTISHLQRICCVCCIGPAQGTPTPSENGDIMTFEDDDDDDDDDDDEEEGSNTHRERSRSPRPVSGANVVTDVIDMNMSIFQPIHKQRHRQISPRC